MMPSELGGDRVENWRALHTGVRRQKQSLMQMPTTTIAGQDFLQYVVSSWSTGPVDTLKRRAVYLTVAQLVERGTVIVILLLSLGRWFDSVP